MPGWHAGLHSTHEHVHARAATCARAHAEARSSVRRCLLAWACALARAPPMRGPAEIESDGESKDAAATHTRRGLAGPRRPCGGAASSDADAQDDSDRTTTPTPAASRSPGRATRPEPPSRIRAADLKGARLGLNAAGADRAHSARTHTNARTDLVPSVQRQDLRVTYHCAPALGHPTRAHAHIVAQPHVQPACLQVPPIGYPKALRCLLDTPSRCSAAVGRG